MSQLPATAVPARHRTILLVDDDPIVTLLLTHGLTARDCNVAVAATWAEAQKQLETLRPALIVLDLMLPDADGRNALVALRENPDTAATPIFILSSGTGHTIPLAECMALGATRYFQKPFSPKEVVTAVEEALMHRVR